ncbi:unnamed protein product [Vitrella brassicaformis CCMP3155]|uniref:Uncharacterized protein n=1 Tax=Vitrella brassicaformis (strain CCMP3155) TaxID=1169540 RepID=A0A0G4F1P9_VITBC|nr:unnamed protein product [Vitrella brassicaformis CCMP3155]|eukprot:CEM05825.1 unnamed protein product [Vitrella brassicaformis CCMP3155]
MMRLSRCAVRGFPLPRCFHNVLTLALAVISWLPVSLAASLRTHRIDDTRGSKPLSALQLVAAGYGPASCVKVSRSKSGSCVIATQCDDAIDTSDVEFAFICVRLASPSGHKAQLHSYGVGTSDAEEDFDSGVRCDECLPPLAFEDRLREDVRTGRSAADRYVAAPHSQVQRRRQTLQQPNATTAAAPDSTSAKTTNAPSDTGKETTFLPTPTVSPTTAKPSPVPAAPTTPAPLSLPPELLNMTSTERVKVLRTLIHDRMKEVRLLVRDLLNYDLGLTCVDENGQPTRHMFGKESFAPQELFDSLIECESCQGLPDNNSTVVVSKEVDELRSMMSRVISEQQKVEQEVESLDVAVFGTVAPELNHTSGDMAAGQNNLTHIDLTLSPDLLYPSAPPAAMPSHPPPSPQHPSVVPTTTPRPLLSSSPPLPSLSEHTEDSNTTTAGPPPDGVDVTANAEADADVTTSAPLDLTSSTVLITNKASKKGQRANLTTSRRNKLPHGGSNKSRREADQSEPTDDEETDDDQEGGADDGDYDSQQSGYDDWSDDTDDTVDEDQDQ